MILNAVELNAIKPLLTIVDTLHNNVVMETKNHNGRHVTMDLSAGGILIRLDLPDSGPNFEFYRTPQGIAQAYGVGLQRITNLREGS